MATQVKTPKTKKITVQAVRDAGRADWSLAAKGGDGTFPNLRDLVGDDVVDAAIDFRGLASRRTNPDGHFDGGGRWYPSDDNTCPKCASVRPPSRNWPYSYMKHCRTADHVSLVAGVDSKMVKRVAKAIDQLL